MSDNTRQTWLKRLSDVQTVTLWDNNTLAWVLGVKHEDLESWRHGDISAPNDSTWTSQLLYGVERAARAILDGPLSPVTEHKKHRRAKLLARFAEAVLPLADLRGSDSDREVAQATWNLAYALTDWAPKEVQAWLKEDAE